MAKCPECLSKKGQRICRATGSLVCSPCCGQIRKAATCLGCVYFKDSKPKRNYTDIPRFSPNEMERDFDLQDASNVIEGAIGAWDHSLHDTLKDEAAIRVLELLLDKYYFHDEAIEVTDETIRHGFDQVSTAIESGLTDVSSEDLCKILGVIRFVARRRTQGRREYLTVVRNYVGTSVAPGVRILPNYRT